MAAREINRETTRRLWDAGFPKIGWNYPLTVTDLRNALEAMEAKQPTLFSNAWDEFKYLTWQNETSALEVYDMLTDAEAMAGAVIEYLEWRAKG